MDDLFWLTEAQMARLKPFFPLSHGVPRVDDRRVLSGIIFINRNGLRWRDAPAAYGPPKTLYNRWVRWSRLGVFARILTELAAEGQEVEVVMIDATHLRGVQTVHRTHKGRVELETARRDGCQGAAHRHVSERRADQRLHRCAGTAVVPAQGRGSAGGSRL
jgi:transposase